MGRRQARCLLLVVLGVSCLSWTGAAQATNTQHRFVGSRQYSPRQATAQGAVHRRLLDSTAPPAAATRIGAVTGPAATVSAAAVAAGVARSAAAQPAADSTAGKAGSDAASAVAPANAAAPAAASQPSSTPQQQQQQQVTAQVPATTTPKADTAPVAPRWIPPSERHAIPSAGTSVGNLPAAPHAGPATDSSSSSKSDAIKPADQAPKLDSSMTGTKAADSAPMVNDSKVADQSNLKSDSITVTAQLVNSVPTVAAADNKVAGQAQDDPKLGSINDSSKPVDSVPSAADSKVSGQAQDTLMPNSSKDSTKPADSVSVGADTKHAEQTQDASKPGSKTDSSKDSAKSADSVSVGADSKHAEQTQDASKPGSKTDSSKDSTKSADSVSVGADSKHAEPTLDASKLGSSKDSTKPVDRTSTVADSKLAEQAPVLLKPDSSKDSTMPVDSAPAESHSTKAADQSQDMVKPSLGSSKDNTKPVDSAVAGSSKATQAADQIQEVLKPSLDSSKDSSAKPIDGAAAAARSSTASQADTKVVAKETSNPATAAADDAAKQTSSSSNVAMPVADQSADKAAQMEGKPAFKAEAPPAAADTTAKQNKPTDAQQSVDSGSKTVAIPAIGSAPASPEGAVQIDTKSSSSSSSEAKSEATKPVDPEQPTQKVDSTPAATVPATQLDSTSSSSNAAPKQTPAAAPQDKPQSAADTTAPAKPGVTDKAPLPEAKHSQQNAQSDSRLISSIPVTDSALKQASSNDPKVAEVLPVSKAPVQETKVASAPATDSATPKQEVAEPKSGAPKAAEGQTAPLADSKTTPAADKVTQPPSSSSSSSSGATMPPAAPAAAPAVPAAAPKGPLKDKAGRNVRKQGTKNSSRGNAPIAAPKQGSTIMKYSWIVPSSATVPAAVKAPVMDASGKAAPATIPTHRPDSSSSSSSRSNDKAAQPHSTSAEVVQPAIKQPKQQVAPKVPTVPAAPPQPAPAAAPAPAPASSSGSSSGSSAGDMLGVHADDYVDATKMHKSEDVAKAELAAAEAKAAQKQQATVQPQAAAQDHTKDQPAPTIVSKETTTTAPMDPAPKQAQKVPAVTEDAAAPVTPATPAAGNNAQADTKTPSVSPVTTQMPAVQPTADTATEDDTEASAETAPAAATDIGSSKDFKLLLPSHLKKAAPTANTPWLPNSNNVGAWKAPSTASAGPLKALPPVVQPTKAKEAAKPKFNPQPLVNVQPIAMAQPQQPQQALVNVQPVVVTQPQQPQGSMQLQPPSAAAPAAAVTLVVPTQTAVPQATPDVTAPTPIPAPAQAQAQNSASVQIPVQVLQQPQVVPQVQQPQVLPQAQQPQVPAAVPTINRNIALSRPGFGPFSAGTLRTAPPPASALAGHQAGQQQSTPGHVAGRFGGAPSPAAHFAARFTGEPRPTIGAHTAHPEAHGAQPTGQPYGANHMTLGQHQPAVTGTNSMSHSGPHAMQFDADVVVADPKAIADVFAEDSDDAAGSGWKSLKPATGAVDEEDFFAGAAGFRFVDPEPWYEAYDEWHDVPEDRSDDDEDRELERELRKLERDVDEYAAESDNKNGGKSGGKDDNVDTTEENILKKLGLKEPEQEVDNVMEFFKNLNIKPKDKKKKAYYYDPSEDKPKNRQHRRWDRERDRKPTYYALYAERDAEGTQSGAALMGQSTGKADKKASSKSSPISSKAPAARARLSSDSSKGVTNTRAGDTAGKQTGLDRGRQSSHKAHTHSDKSDGERTARPNAPALSDSDKVKQMAKAAVSILGDKGWRMISINKAEDLEYIKAGVTEYNRNHKKPMFLLAWSP